ncbi:MAG: glycosyltransferase family 2 protein [Patescibacteria group bacterium]
MSHPKISIIIIHYNTPQYLQTCFDAILQQSYPNIEIIFIDNNSPDKSGLEFIKKKYGNVSSVKIVPNEENIGFAKAANQGIRMAVGSGAEHLQSPSVQAQTAPADYIVITNPDIIYTPSYFEIIVERMEKDEKIAAITGKVYKYDFDRQKPTNIIDTVGIFAYKSRRFIDDGQGLIDEGQFDKECEIFGVSGACPLYRREALEDVKILGEYFDEDFFMYKEDVDLSWRFLLYGWKNLFYPKAVAYHGRGTGVQRRFFNKEVLAIRNKLSKFQKQHSFTNQHLMEAKNELWANFFADFIPIMIKKLAVFAYITVKEPYLWMSYFRYLKKLPGMFKKRAIIMKNKKISAKEMRKWFKKQSKYLK